MGKRIKGQDAVKAANKNGLEVTFCNGDHIKITAPAGRGYMIVYPGELSAGVDCKVKKWFKTLGIVLGIFLVCALITVANIV